MKRTFKCTGCGNARPCILETNQETNPMSDIEDLSCVLDNTNQTSFNWKEIVNNVIKRPTAEEILTLIKRLPDAKNHIYISTDKVHCVTNEFFAGAFAGRSFEGSNFEDAAEQLIDYMYEHIEHDSIIGKVVTASGFPDLNKLYNYCK